MNKILEHILSIPKSFYVSLKYFPLKDAVKLPIMVRYNTVLLGLKGKITNLGAKYDEEYVMLAGSPAVIKKHNITLRQITDRAQYSAFL